MNIEAFEQFIINNGYDIENVTEDMVNEFCSELFYDCETEDDIETLNVIENEIRKKYLEE